MRKSKATDAQLKYQKPSKIDRYYNGNQAGRNQYTGKRRKWVYKGAARRVDLLFQLAEVESQKDPKTVGQMEAMLQTYETLTRRMRELVTEHKLKTALTPQELRYCKLEGISPEDFAKAKAGRVAQ